MTTQTYRHGRWSLMLLWLVLQFDQCEERLLTSMATTYVLKWACLSQSSCYSTRKSGVQKKSVVWIILPSVVLCDSVSCGIWALTWPSYGKPKPGAKSKCCWRNWILILFYMISKIRSYFKNIINTNEWVICDAL